MGSSAMDEGNIHVWTIDLTSQDDAEAFVTDSDRDRRYAFDRDRRRHLAGRGALRRILARYTGAHPLDLWFETGEWGKPWLRGWPHLRFSFSHSGDAALCAVARTEVGIDIEEVRPVESMFDLARRYFSPAEAGAILDAHHRRDAFFRCWTRKEAYVKARGQGLSISLASFAVSLDADSPRLLHSDCGDADRWRMWNVPAPAGYVAALAAESGTIRPQRFVLHQFETERN